MLFEVDNALGLPWLALSETCSCGGSAKARGPLGQLVCWRCWANRFSVLMSAEVAARRSRVRKVAPRHEDRSEAAFGGAQGRAP